MKEATLGGRTYQGEYQPQAIIEAEEAQRQAQQQPEPTPEQPADVGTRRQDRVDRQAASQTLDREALLAEFQSLTDKRISGLTSMFDKKLNEIRAQQPQSESESAPGDEADDSETDGAGDEAIAMLRLENELLRMGQQYPREVEVLQRLLAAESVQDYVTALHEAFNPEPETQVSDVDRNNPPINALWGGSIDDMIHLPDGRMLTREQGMELLRDASTLHG
jgi:hypothetical protein